MAQALYDENISQSEFVEDEIGFLAGAETCFVFFKTLFQTVDKRNF